MSEHPSTPPQDRRSSGARESHDALRPEALEDEDPDEREEADEPGRDAGQQLPRPRRAPA